MSMKKRKCLIFTLILSVFLMEPSFFDTPAANVTVQPDMLGQCILCEEDDDDIEDIDTDVVEEDNISEQQEIEENVSDLYSKQKYRRVGSTPDIHIQLPLIRWRYPLVTYSTQYLSYQSYHIVYFNMKDYINMIDGKKGSASLLC